MDIESMKQGIEGNRLLKGIILAFGGGTYSLFYCLFHKRSGV